MRRFASPALVQNAALATRPGRPLPATRPARRPKRRKPTYADEIVAKHRRARSDQDKDAAAWAALTEGAMRDATRPARKLTQVELAELNAGITGRREAYDNIVIRHEGHLPAAVTAARFSGNPELRAFVAQRARELGRSWLVPADRNR